MIACPRIRSRDGRLRSRVDGTDHEDRPRAIALVPPEPADAPRGNPPAAHAFQGVVPPQESGECATEARAIAERLDEDGPRAPAPLVLAGFDADREVFARAGLTAEPVGDEHAVQCEADALAGHHAEAVELTPRRALEPGAGLATALPHRVRTAGVGRHPPGIRSP
jgi:hypothetical protein